MEEISIFDYLDYRDYLRDHYRMRKDLKGTVSYRFLGERVGIDPSYLVKIFMKQKHLALKSIPVYGRYLKLSSKEQAYFETLVHFAKAESNAESTVYFDKLVALRQQEGVTITKDQYDFYRHWRHSAVRQALECFVFDGSQEETFAQFIEPEITVEELKDSIALLERLQLIHRLPDQRWMPRDTVITTGDVWKTAAVHAFQNQTIDLSRRALQELPKELRDISTLTFSMPLNEIPLVREKIREFRQSIIRYANQVESLECVCQMNIQLFPLTKGVQS